MNKKTVTIAMVWTFIISRTPFPASVHGSRRGPSRRAANQRLRFPVRAIFPMPVATTPATFISARSPPLSLTRMAVSKVLDATVVAALETVPSIRGASRLHLQNGRHPYLRN